jgi:hypothetical protein
MPVAETSATHWFRGSKMKWANKSRHRMSGDKGDLKFKHLDMPLIGALPRWAEAP